MILRCRDLPRMNSHLSPLLHWFKLPSRQTSSIDIPPLPTCRTDGSEAANVDMAKLCPNEKMVDERRFSDVRGCGGIDTSIQS